MGQIARHIATRKIIQENKRLRESCRQHDFQKEFVEGKFFGAYVCSKCGTRADRAYVKAYEEGLLHGRIGG